MTDTLTKDLPGTGGTIREHPDDFQVEEIPLYEPCGTGDHLYLRVEKTGLTTYDLLRELARAFGCRERDLGYAGLKDARALTRQTVSVPVPPATDVSNLQIPGVTILGAERHRNKLRPGHLAGNRFRIRIRDPQADALARAQAILAALVKTGVPNRFGTQRYGALGNSHRIGGALLRGDYPAAIREIIGTPEAITHPGWRTAAEAYRAGDLDTAITNLPRHCRPERKLLTMLRNGAAPRKAVLAMPRKLLRLYLSAYQSSLFDRLLTKRLPEINRIWPGDIAYKHVNGASFLVTDPELEQPRADAFEISATGPMFGYKMRLAQERAGSLEADLLAAEDLDLQTFRLPGGLAMEGERRALRVPLQVADCSLLDNDLVLAFSLPRGSFATSLLAEVIKTPGDVPIGK
ncbi:MAG: tRNA pseudouridine(13) synthase TruD [Desulfuromonadales bacterium]|jgi:tRNA pseudouridine13 synthase